MEKTQAVAQQILDRLDTWVHDQETGSLSVQNLKHATGILKDIRDILKTDAPDEPVEIKVQIGKEEFAQ